MSRYFDGGTAADTVTFSLGAGPTSEGPITVAVLAHAASVANWTGWMIQGVAGASASWAMLTSTNTMFIENDFTAGGPALTTGWCWYVFTKAAGSATPRWHLHDLTAGTGWTHADGAGAVTSPGVTATGILLGSSAAASATQTWRGRIAAAAAWNSVLSDTAVQAACTVAADDLATAGPSWGVLLNQASTATAVVDFTGGGGNQTALSGTAVDADEPPGWSYTINPAAVIPKRPVVPTGAVHRAATY